MLSESGRRAQSVLLIPGFFGFGTFGPESGKQIDYFWRVRPELEKYLPGDVVFEHHEPPPTGALTARVRSLWEKLRSIRAERIDLVGYSIGGLDARLLTNTAYDFPGAPSFRERRELLGRIGNIVTVATPFHGTPMARRLRPVAGRSLLALYLLSILTSGEELRFGGKLLLAYMTVLKEVGLRGSWNDRVIQGFLAGADDATSDQIRRFLRKVVEDHGVIVDLQPSLMERLNATLGGSDFPRIQSFATVAPRPIAGLRLSKDPFDTAVRRLIYGIAYELAEPPSAEQRPFPQGPWLGAHDPMLELGGPQANDGVIPTGSQTIDGQAVGIVAGDHLDVVGHFESQAGGGTFFKSGANFDDDRFVTFWAAVANALKRPF